MSRLDEIRLKAESDLEAFINLVQPIRLLGQVHKDLIRWANRDDRKSHLLILLPRDHQKSAIAAFQVAWEITRNPSIRVLYISSTAKLAVKQLKFIKDILTCPQYRKYWPEMVNIEESKREKWTETEIAVDHPNRKRDSVRDPTVFTAGLTTNIVGLHCDLSVLDDVVVDDTAYTEEGRRKVRDQVSYLASIAGTDSRQLVVGTRYHPKDLYDDMLGMLVEIPGEDGNTAESYPLYECFERVVEDRGDGGGQFLWPRMRATNGQYFGFDAKELAKKRAQYSDPTKFRAQYYNNPNDVGSSSISTDLFQYFDRKLVHRDMDKWYYKNSRLNVFAAVDFAFSLSKKADYTCIVVVGVDSRQNFYVLDIDRFKTNKISEYFEKILRLHSKWNFRKIRAEVNVAQEVIVKDLKENYIRPLGLALSIDEHRPTSKEGTKEERIEATLQPKYANKQMWHYSGGNCSLLEEELTLQRPSHDDIKDCLACCIDICVPPSFQNMVNAVKQEATRGTFIHSRFGGVG
jgi:hypothetical protein